MSKNKDKGAKGRVLIYMHDGKTESIRTTEHNADKVAARYLNKTGHKFFPDGSSIPKPLKKKVVKSGTDSIGEMLKNLG